MMRPRKKHINKTNSTMGNTEDALGSMYSDVSPRNTDGSSNGVKRPASSSTAVGFNSVSLQASFAVNPVVVSK